MPFVFPYSCLHSNPLGTILFLGRSVAFMRESQHRHALKATQRSFSQGMLLPLESKAVRET